ncbi:DUF4236 domain-containing protein [Pseudomonas aeruginosa]|uniref:DUF4236 domain-containing protein n=1 Tax=Pseudomonas aeruginosa TaxID=287 RepID=UPI00053DC627|nr:DUF4236 domain-containing protein [Pseudomonas aeruginosa]MDI4074160.1 DUF4236 domain-containing protein [Pseudomonas aeruginosa]MED5027103.1 DUF4236 domain-containing protein [Pseudomonas aeruginosa]
MGLSVRKSVRVGPFRFNLSKSGIGVSAGIKGLRIGTGPRGNYIHMGRGGFYYRQTLPSNSSAPAIAPPKPVRAPTPVVDIPSHTHEPLKEIDSGEIGLMVDSSSQALVDELNTKRKRLRLWPFVAALTVGALVLSAKQLPPWALLTLLIVGGLLMAVTYYWDLLRKTTVMLYDIESEFAGVVEQLHTAFDGVRSCRATWHLQAQGKVLDRKYHAGASHLVTRSSIALGLQNPPFVKTNVATPSIPVGRQTLYFFPDKVLVFEANGVGAVSYENLRIDISTTNFIEDGAVPKDAEIVSRTWKFVNKKGGPDRRFKNNRELPVVRYEEVQFSSNTGLLERIQISCVGRTSSLAQAIGSIGRAKGERQ